MTETPQPPSSFAVTHGAQPLPPALSGAVVAIGNFDGVHRGHRAVIAAARNRAQTLGRPAAALTFEPHPRSFFRPHEPLFRLTDESAKLRLFAATGLSGAIVLRFDAALAEPAPESFVNDILLHQLGISGAVVGFDFRFGRNRTGTPDLLAAEGRRRNFTVDVVPAVEIDGRPISSGAPRLSLVRARGGRARRQARTRARLSDRQYKARSGLRVAARHLCGASRRRRAAL
jgi:riboflavin kinase/FMN adenylyltransferase